MSAPPVRPVRRALTDWTVDYLYNLIFTGALPAGADLGEEELRQRLDVSRTTVSAALRQLEADGLAIVAAGNGRRVVATFGPSDIHELYTIRAGLEELAVRRVAPTADAGLVRRLSGLQDEIERAARRRRDPNRRDFTADLEFHRTIVEATGSRRLLNCLNPVWNQTHALLRHVCAIGAYGSAADDDAAYRDHRRLIDSLAARDAAVAAKAVRAHLHGRRDDLVTGVRAHGGTG